MANRFPMHELHAGAGARFKLVCGWELPQDYGNAAAEYTAVRRGVGLIDRGHYGVVEVTGRDRAAFLHAMLSNDINSLAPGQGCMATLLDVHGKVQVVLTVLVLDDRILMVTPPAMAEKTVQGLDRYLFSEKAYLRDATGEMALLICAGPAARPLAERLTGARPPEIAWSHLAASLNGIDVRVVGGSGETGETEIWIIGASADGPRIWNAALDKGARPVGISALESLRVEAGTPLFGHDVDSTVLLPEIPFASLVSYSKGCYVGQEVVVRIRDRGHVNRMLRGILLDGDTVPPHDAAVFADDAEVGKVTSAAWSFGLARPLGLAFVRRQHAESGTAVTVRTESDAIPGTVSALPFSR